MNRPKHINASDRPADQYYHELRVMYQTRPELIGHDNYQKAVTQYALRHDRKFLTIARQLLGIAHKKLAN